MRKVDDCTLTYEQETKIRQEAKRLLEESGAFGQFPTPIADVMAVAKVQEVEEDVLNINFIENIRNQLVKTGKVLRKAVSKVLGLFDARSNLIFIDRSLPLIKQIFIKLHETAHGYLKWQKDMYAVVEDCEHSLDPDVAELFDREANVFASEVLFQIDSFIEEANDHKFSIFTPVKLSKKYGSSIYSAVRQYVSKNHQSCTVIVLDPPSFIEVDGFRANVRRIVSSQSFIKYFGNFSTPEYFTPNDIVGAMVPINGRRASGKREIILEDNDGTKHLCIAEAFTNTYQVFILILVKETLKNRSVLLWNKRTSV